MVKLAHVVTSGHAPGRGCRSGSTGTYLLGDAVAVAMLFRGPFIKGGEVDGSS